jgi:monovalent cation:H+ antiporter-2, CPA2 family
MSLPFSTQNFLQDLTLVMCVGALFTVVFRAIRQPVVVGYLLAGMMIGPHTPVQILADYGRIHALSDFGVILLVFSLGLDFGLRKLLRTGPTSGFIMMMEVGLMVWLGYMCGRALGWTKLESIFTGAVISISSTTIVAKAFQEMTVSERLRDLVFGVDLMEDLGAIVEVALLTALASGARVSAQLMFETVGRLLAFLILFVAIGILIVPYVIKRVVRLKSPETTLIASIGVCFALAIIAQAANYSVTLGAFLAGCLVAEAGEVQEIEHLVAPVRDVFGAVFFVSVGMMIDPALIAVHWQALIVLCIAVVAGKTMSVSLASLLSGAGTKLSIQAGMSLAQIGEFSFIIAGVGLRLNATREFIYTLAVAVSTITTFMAPFMIRLAEPTAELVARSLPSSVGTLQSLYDSWLERIRSARRLREESMAMRGPILLISLCAVTIAAILIFNEFDPLDFTSQVARALGIKYFDAGLLVDLGALMVCAPFAAGIYSGSHRLARALAIRALPAAKRATLEVGWGDAERALVEMLQLTILFGVLGPLLAVVQPFMEEVEGIGIFVIAIALMSIVVTRSARLIQGQMRAAIGLLAASLAEQHDAETEESTHRHEVAGLGSLTGVRVEHGAPGAGKSLRELDLTAATGATVVAIERPDGGLITPGDADVIAAGDIVELAGPSQAVTVAAALFRKPGMGVSPA